MYSFHRLLILEGDIKTYRNGTVKAYQPLTVVMAGLPDRRHPTYGLFPQIVSGNINITRTDETPRFEGNRIADRDVFQTQVSRILNPAVRRFVKLYEPPL